MADIGGDAVVRTAPTPAGENGGADRGGAPTADAGQAGAGAVQPGAGTPAPAGSAGQNGTSRLVAVSDPHPPVNVNPAATKEAAIVYLDTVRQRLQRTNPDLYHRFLDTMKDFRSHRCVAVGYAGPETLVDACQMPTSPAALRSLDHQVNASGDCNTYQGHV